MPVHAAMLAQQLELIAKEIKKLPPKTGPYSEKAYFEATEAARHLGMYAEDADAATAT
jgi:hypothetical protein